MVDVGSGLHQSLDAAGLPTECGHHDRRVTVVAGAVDVGSGSHQWVDAAGVPIECGTRERRATGIVGAVNVGSGHCCQPPKCFLVAVMRSS